MAMMSALKALGPEAVQMAQAEAMWPVWHALPMQLRLGAMLRGVVTPAAWEAQACLVGTRLVHPSTAMVVSREARQTMA
jgi:hypothetical protein